MPITASPPQDQLQYEPTPNRKLWTRSECETMVETGMLTGRYELIDGEIVDTMGQGWVHGLTIKLVAQWLITLFGYLQVREQQREHRLLGLDDVVHRRRCSLPHWAMPA